MAQNITATLGSVIFLVAFAVAVSIESTSTSMPRIASESKSEAVKKFRNLYLRRYQSSCILGCPISADGYGSRRKEDDAGSFRWFLVHYLDSVTDDQTVESPTTEINQGSTEQLETSQPLTPTETQKIETTLPTAEKTVPSQTPNSAPSPSVSSTSNSSVTTQQPRSSTAFPSSSFNTSNPNDSKKQVYNLSYSCSFKSSQNPCEEITAKIPLLTSKGEYLFFNHTPNIFIHPKNICVKNITIEICGQQSQLASASTGDSFRNSSSSSSSPLVDSVFSHTLQKCCPMGALLTMNTSREANCLKYQDPPWKPGNFMVKSLLAIGVRMYPNYNISAPACDSYNYILPHQLETKIHGEKYSLVKFKGIRVLENGEVETRESGNHDWKNLEKNNYCIDGYYHADLTLEKLESFMVLQCKPKKSEWSEIKDTVFAAACFISSVVLLIIVIVYALIWNQQNIHEWTKCVFSLAMLFWLLFTGVRIWYTKDDSFCVFIAVATHFFRIFLFSWMLLMNFDLWATISSMRAKSQRSKGHTRFVCYCIVALAIPTIVVSISLIMENQFSLFDDSVTRPQYGRARCSLDHTAVKAYAIYPTIILFLPNLIFILLTFKFLADVKKASKKFQKNSDSKFNSAQNEKDRAQMKLYIKLFVIMGISWIFDIISGLLDTDEVSWYWMITDIYNIAQPFFLFWLFICKRTIREQLSSKYSFFKVGFKWIEVHSPRCSATQSATSSEQNESPSPSQSQSQSQATKSTPVTSRDDNLA